MHSVSDRSDRDLYPKLTHPRERDVVASALEASVKVGQHSVEDGPASGCGQHVGCQLGGATGYRSQQALTVRVVQPLASGEGVDQLVRGARISDQEMAWHSDCFEANPATTPYFD
jgi:hypothetical protein